MQRRKPRKSAQSRTAQALIRICIAAYFLAGAVGLLEGANLAPLFEGLLPAPYAAHAATAAAVVLSALILFDRSLWPAALLMGTGLFWASYLEMQARGVADSLAPFWRDLALIAALMLSYAKAGDHASLLAKVMRRSRPRPVAFGEKVTPRRITRGGEVDPVTVRLPMRSHVAVPVPGPEPVFHTSRQKPLRLTNRIMPDEPENIFGEPEAERRAS